MLEIESESGRPSPRPARQFREIAGEITLFALSLGIGLLGAGLLVGIATLFIERSQTELWQLLSVFEGPSALAIAWLFYRWMGQRMPNSDSPPLNPGVASPAKPLMASAIDTIFGIVLAIVGSGVIANLLGLLGVQVEEQSKILEMIHAGKVIDLLALSLSALVLAPLVEEGLFRGLFFGRLLQRLPTLAAYACSSIVFALIHLNPSGILIYAWLGCVFAWTYQRSGRLGCAVLVHAGNNAASLTLLLLFPGGPNAP